VSDEQAEGFKQTMAAWIEGAQDAFKRYRFKSDGFPTRPVEELPGADRSFGLRSKTRTEVGSVFEPTQPFAVAQSDFKETTAAVAQALGPEWKQDTSAAKRFGVDGTRTVRFKNRKIRPVVLVTMSKDGEWYQVAVSVAGRTTVPAGRRP
jgi:hypothetical protein